MKKLALISRVPLVVVALAVVIAPMAAATRKGAPIPPYSVVFAKNGAPLKVLALGAGRKLDVVWKGGGCSNGYQTPPAVATWSGLTDAGTPASATAAPSVQPCGPAAKAAAGLDMTCVGLDHFPWAICYWTWGANPNTGVSASRLANPESAENANLFLYKRTAKYAYLMKPGATTWSKIAVPVGTNEVHWYGAHGG